MRVRAILGGFSMLAVLAGALVAPQMRDASAAAVDEHTVLYRGDDPYFDPEPDHPARLTSSDGTVVLFAVDETAFDVVDTRTGVVTSVDVPERLDGSWRLSADGRFVVHSPDATGCVDADTPISWTVTAVRIADGRVQTRTLDFGAIVAGGFIVEFAPAVDGCNAMSGPFDVLPLDDLTDVRTIGDASTTWRTQFDHTASPASATPTLFVSPRDDRGIVERLHDTTVEWIDLGSGEVVRSLTSLTGHPLTRSQWSDDAVAYGEVAAASPTSANVRLISMDGVSPAVVVPVPYVEGTVIGGTFSTIVDGTLYVTRIGDPVWSTHTVPTVAGFNTSLGGIPGEDAIAVEHVESSGRTFRRIPLDLGPHDVVAYPQTFADIPTPGRMVPIEMTDRATTTNFDPATLSIDFDEASIVSLSEGRTVDVHHGIWLEVDHRDDGAELVAVAGTAAQPLDDRSLDQHVHACASTCTRSGFLRADDEGYAAYYATATEFVLERVEFAPPTATTTTTGPGPSTTTTPASTTTTAAPATPTTTVDGPTVVAVDDDARLSGSDAVLTIDVLANDTVAGGALDPSSVEIVAAPAMGTATVGAGAAVSLTLPSETVADSTEFTYRVCAIGSAVCDTAEVTVAIGRRFLAPRVEAPFADVPDGAYFTTPVAWLVVNQITTGTSPTTFSPDECVSRGQLAAFLHRLVDPPTASTEARTPFVDVPAGAFFAGPVAWLVAEEITTGTSATTFSPDRCVTRGELATFFHRLAGIGIPDAGTTPFTDVAPSAFYADAVGWMVAERITTGTTPTTFSPGTPVTRAQFAAFTHRLATASSWRP